MHVPVYILCVALIVCVKCEQTSNFYGRKIQPLDLKADQETVNYFLPKLAAKYRPNNDWNVVTDPRFYLLTEMESRNLDYQDPLEGPEIAKRQGLNNGPSLSIVNSLDVLRNRLLLEITRKQQQEGIKNNRVILTHIGKRSARRFSELGYDNNF